MKSELHNKEILEMILQFLYENNFKESANLLEKRANIIFDQNEIQKLKNSLSTQQYDEAIKLIETSSHEKNQKLEVLKLIKAKKYVEMIKREERSQAMNFLRNELTPLYEQDPETLKKISALLFKKEPKSLEKYLINNFPDFLTDSTIVQRVQDLLCLSFDTKGNRILPNGRLLSLVKQYNDYRQSNMMDIDDLHPDYFEVDKDKVSLNNNFIIEKHDDEVWFIEFTESYVHFATCSRNGMISVYKNIITPSKVTVECVCYFQAHRKYITSLAWTKNEQHLFTSSTDKTVKMWDPFEGKCLRTFSLHTDIVNSVKLLDNQTFVSGGIDKKLVICKTDGTTISNDTFYRIREILVSQALGLIVIIPASMNEIILFDYRHFREEKKINMEDPIISAALSKNDEGIYLIANLSKINASINLYNLQDLSLQNKFYGHIQEQYIIKCSFAGENDQFILSGSEDFTIFIWHRSNSVPLITLQGHTGSVNCVEWLFQKEVSALFSVSDDYTLRIWTNEKVEVVYNDIKQKGVNETNGIAENGKKNGTGLKNNTASEILDLIGNDNESNSGEENVQNNEDLESENSS